LSIQEGSGMVIRHAPSGGYSIDSLLNTSHSSRWTRTNAFVLGGVALAHLGLAIYLYGQHFSPSRLEPRADPAPVILEIPRLAPETPEVSQRPAPRPLPVHAPSPVSVQAPQPLPIRPELQSRSPATSTVATLPTGPLIQAVPELSP
jgi:hypothetical protein